MMKKLLSLLSVNVAMMSAVSFTIACKKNDPINVDLPLKTLFESITDRKVAIGVSDSLLTMDEQSFTINKKIDDYFKNLQFIALSVLNKIEKSCFLNTSFIEVSLYRTSNISQPIRNNYDLQRSDIALTKEIYVGFATITQIKKDQKNNFESLLRLEFVEYDKGMFNMEEKLEKPYCDFKPHEL